MAEAEDIQPLVCDNGTGMVKALSNGRNTVETVQSSSSMDLYNTHVKLLAFDFLSLSSALACRPSCFLRKGLRLSRAESIGVVVTRDFKPDRFLRFSIDDGTGCIPCILWLNQRSSPYFSRRNPSTVRSIAQTALKFASDIQLGAVARVRGKITGFRGSVQITVSDVMLERNPNTQVLHWLDCMRLARRCYDKFSNTAKTAA